MSRKVDVAIIGAGTAGLNAFSQVIKKTTQVVLINDGPYGTTCARVGCMPSKALIEVAQAFAKRHQFAALGIQGAEQLTLDRQKLMHHVRGLRDFFVSRVMDSVNKIAEKNLQGRARFIGPQTLVVNDEHIEAEKVIIASGSRPIVPPQWQTVGDRLITTDELFELTTLPESIAVIGLGAIGSEIGQALAQLGVKVIGIEASQWVAGLADPVVNQEAVETLSHYLELYMETEAQQLSVDSNGKVRIELNKAPAVTVDQVLVSLGRRPNLDDLGLEVFGIHSAAELKQQLNPQTMQVGNWPLFVAGDGADFRAILHEASDEGMIAGYNAVHEPITAFKRRATLRIVFTQPQIVTVGTPFNQLPATAVIGERSFKVQGRTKIMGQNQGHLRVYANRDSGQLLGAELMVTEAEYIGHFLALALERSMTVAEIMRTPFYHPTVMEGLDNALAAINKELGHPQPILSVKAPQ